MSELSPQGWPLQPEARHSHPRQIGNHHLSPVGGAHRLEPQMLLWPQSGEEFPRNHKAWKSGSHSPHQMPTAWAELGVLLKTEFPPDRKGCSSSVGKSFLKTYLIPDKAKHLSVVLRLELTSVSYPFSPVQRAVLYPHWLPVST